MDKVWCFLTVQEFSRKKPDPVWWEMLALKHIRYPS